jgi:thiamine biosynthesis lipoprotein
MACRFEITLSGEHSGHIAAAREALDEVDRIEDALTVFRDSSEAARVNREAAGGPVPVSDMLFCVLQRCREVYEAVEGAFDPTAGPLSRCWGFQQREGRLPDDTEIAAALDVVGLDKVDLDADGRTVRFLRQGMALNFGGIGKGYALDRAAALLRERGVPRALLSAGGSSVLAFGGEGFPVELRSPRAADVIAHVEVAEAALGTSGAGEQFFEAGGRRYGHVLDPRTGWPASGVLSASVASAAAADADALSTAFLVGGPALAQRYCDAHPGTLALLTLEADPSRLARFGQCGAIAIVQA